MNCPKCNSEHVTKCGHVKSGKQKMTCKDCKKQWILGADKIGRPSELGRPMTNAERQQKYKEKKKKKHLENP